MIRKTLLAAFFLSITLACQAIPTASTDRVPTEDWTYQAMMHLASRDLVPDMTAQRFMGDWQYDREEMAGFVRDVVTAHAKDLGDSDRGLVARLAAEFAPELIVMGSGDVLKTIGAYDRRLGEEHVGSFQPSVLQTNGDTKAIGIYGLTEIGMIGRYTTAQVTLSDRRSKFGGDRFSTLESFFIRGKTPNWEWEVGKDWFWWGPGYSGSMILSDNAPAFPMFKLAKDFNFGKHIGNVKVTEFGSSFFDQGERVYLLGRRWEKRFSNRMHLGVNETAKTSKTPNPLAFLLPSLYLYQHIYLKDVDRQWNSFVSLDMSYKFSNRFDAYTDLLIDDLNAPSVLRQPGQNFHRPRRIGALVGGHWPDLFGDGTTGLRGELILTDAGTYVSARPDVPQMDYVEKGLVIGHPVGTNSEAIFLRLDRKIAKGWTGAAEYLGRKPHKIDGPNPEKTHQLSLLVVRDMSSSFSWNVRYESLKLPESENRFQVSLGYAF